MNTLLITWFAIMIFAVLVARSQFIDEEEAKLVASLAKYLKYDEILLLNDKPTPEIYASFRRLAEQGLVASFSNLYDGIRGASSYFYYQEFIAPWKKVLTVLRLKAFDKIFVRYFKLNPLIQQNAALHGYLALPDSAEIFLPNSTLPIGCEAMFVRRIENSFEIWEHYFTLDEIFTNKLATWNRGSLEPLPLFKKPLQRRRSLYNVTMVKETLPLMRSTSFKKTVEAFREYYYCLEQLFGFKTRPSEEGKLLPDVMDRNIQFSSWIPMTFYLISPVIITRANMYTRQLYEDSESNYMFRPFSTTLWMVIIGWILAAAMSLAWLFRESNEVWFYSFYRVLANFCGQDEGKDQIGLVGRMISVMVWMTVMVTLAAYSAVIISFILVRKPYEPFTNLKEFMEDGTYKYGGIRGTFHTRVQQLDSNYLDVAKKHLDLTNLIETLEEGMERVCSEPKFAFLANNNDIMSAHPKCPLQKMREPFYKTLDTVYVSANFSSSRILREKVPTLWTSGIMHRMQSQVDYSPPHRKEQTTPPVDLQLIRYIVLILPFSCLLSLIILAFELITLKIKLKK